MAKTRSSTIDVSERMVPEYHKGHSIYGEHFVRYEAVKDIVNNKIVLDIASGSGYGAKMISRTAKKVYGIDVSDEAINYANKTYYSKNIEYIVGDGETIPLKDSSVDVVVSFETIEHIKDYKKFIGEVFRVLRKDGLLILSTPNELEFAEGNHFHLHEFEENELKELVKTNFNYIKMYYQGDWVFSALLPEKLVNNEHNTSFNLPTLQLAPLKPENYLYFYMICSNREISEEVLPIGAFSEHWSARKIIEKDELTQNHIKNLEDIAESNLKYVRELETRLGEIESERNKISKELGSIKGTLAYRTYKKIKK